MPPTHRLGLLRDHDFRGLFISTSVSQVGHQITSLAIPLVAVLALAATEFEVGLLSAAAGAAFLLVGLPAGAWVDRMRRRNVLLVTDLARAAFLVTIPLAWWADVLTIWQLYVVALAVGVFTVFFDVAYQSYLPHLVGRTNLVEANSKLEAVRGVSHLGGPGLAGVLIQWFTAPVVLVADAVAMATSAAAVWRIRAREDRPQRKPESRLVAEIRDGLRFVLRNRLLRAIAMCTAAFNLTHSAYSAMSIVFLARELELSPGVIGLFMSAGGVGGIIGAAVAKRIAASVGQGPAIWMSVAFTTPFCLLLPMATSPWMLIPAGIASVVMTIGVMVYNITQVSFRQALTPDAMLGRMNATVRFLVWGTMPLGALAGGVLGGLVGARGTLWIVGVLSCLAFLPVALSPLRRMKHLPTEPLDEPGDVAKAEVPTA
ncbi:MAG TPA: MFS transporter [Candidatus Stackebrandtia excrementipullorum]|nr:MFS transporter [Candidatus Stackebrandtia excrementipullorum]